MGALGNGRRGGRSPPLMVGALIACMLVLGFKYWVSSTLNLELQAKLDELVVQVQRGAAERGEAEIKRTEIQDEIQRQKMQISNLESYYKAQLDGAQQTCSSEKAQLLQNISSNSKTVLDLKGLLNQMNDDVTKVQNQLKACESNINTLNKKLTYDMTHCQSQVLSQKELCEERIANIKIEYQKKMEKIIPPKVGPSHLNKETAVPKEDKSEKSALNGPEVPAADDVPNLSHSTGNDTSQIQINNLPLDGGSDVLMEPPAKDSLATVSQSVPSAATQKQGTTQPKDKDFKPSEANDAKPAKSNITEDKKMEVMDTHEQTDPAEDPGMESMLNSQGRLDETPIGQNFEEPEEYDGEDQVVDEGDLGKQSKQGENLDKEMEEELADYNGDDENEGEFEADKQAALAQV